MSESELSEESVTDETVFCQTALSLCEKYRTLAFNDLSSYQFTLTKNLFRPPITA